MDKNTEIGVIAALVGDNSGELWEFQRTLRDYHFKYEPAKKVFALLHSHWRKNTQAPSQGLVRAYLKAVRHKLGNDLHSLCTDVVESAWSAKSVSHARDYVIEFITAQEIDSLRSEMDRLDFGSHQQYIQVLSDRVEQLKGLRTDDEEQLGQTLTPFSQNFLRNWASNVDEAYGGIPVTTGFDRIDKMTSPLYPGELGMFIAPTGRGKSMWLCNVTFHAVHDLGLRCLYVGLDNLAAEFCERFLTIATRLPIEEMKKIYPKHAIERAVQKKYAQLYGEDVSHRLTIQSFPRKSVTTQAIKNVIKKLRPKWIREDRKAGLPEDSWGKLGLLIVDYSALLKPTVVGTADWQNLETICNDISALGQEELCPGWTAAQTTRGSVEKAGGDVQEYHIAGSWGQLAPIRKGVAMQQTKVDRLSNTFGAYLFKGTRSDIDVVFPMKVDYKRQRMYENDNIDPYAVAGQNYESRKDEAEDDLQDDDEFIKKFANPIVHDAFGGVSESSFKGVYD